MVILAALPGIVRRPLVTGKMVNPGNFGATVNFLGFQLRKVGLGRPDVVAWFRELERTPPFSLWGAGRDFVDVSFNQPVEDAEALAARIYDFCPDSVDQGAGTKG